MRWDQRRSAMLESLFPRYSEQDVATLLEERRFVVLQGPPGTGKTRLGLRIATRNTADRSIARIDLAIRRRFALLDIWPDLGVAADH